MQSGRGVTPRQIEETIKRVERLTVGLVYEDGGQAYANRILETDYPHRTAAPDDWTVNEFIRDRFAWLPGDLRVRVMFPDGAPLTSREVKLKQIRWR